MARQAVTDKQTELHVKLENLLVLTEVIIFK